MSTHIPLTIICDLGKNTVSPHRISVNQEEANVKKLQVQFLSNGEPWEIPAGFFCNILMKKSDGFEIYNPAESISSTSAVFNITSQMTASVGKNSFQIQIVKGSDDVRGFTVDLNVQPAVIRTNKKVSEDDEQTIWEIVDDAISQALESFQLDATLSSTDKAAQAKAVGDAIKAAIEQSVGKTDTNIISREMLKPSARGVFIAPNSSRIDIDKKADTVTFNMLIIIGGKRYNITDEVVALPTDLRFIYVIPDDTPVSGGDATAQIALSDTAREDGVYIGSAYQDSIALCYGAAVYKDGVRQHNDYETWTNSNTLLKIGLATADDYVLFDLAHDVIKFPATTYIIEGNKRVVKQNQEDVPIAASPMYLLYNLAEDKFETTNSSFNANDYIGVAYVNKSANFVACVIPHTVITDPDGSYDVLPEIALYGDSIVAGYGSTVPFVNVVSAKSGIRLLNYGIGSTGYLTKVGINTEHLVGQGDVRVGVNQAVTYAENNVESRIAADIGNITTKYVGIMAGTNDIGSYSTEEIVASMESCITTIYDAGKIPIIISPIRKASTDITSLVEAMEIKCGELGCPFISMLNIGLYPQNAANNAQFYTDGLHLNTKGNIVVACKLIGELKKIVSPDGLYGV